MPPPAPLVVNDQFLHPPPVASPIKRPRDEFSLDEDDSPPQRVVQVAVTAKKKAPGKVAQSPQAAAVQVAVTPKKNAPGKVAQSPQAAVVQVTVTPKKNAPGNVAQSLQAAVVQVAVTPNKSPGNVVHLPEPADDADEGSSSSETCSNSDSGEEDGEEEIEEMDPAPPVNVVGNAKAPKMAKITVAERTNVMEWLQKLRKDKKMDNGRWIRNGGAHGATMTATSGEVRTSGAYVALAA